MSGTDTPFKRLTDMGIHDFATWVLGEWSKSSTFPTWSMCAKRARRGAKRGARGEARGQVRILLHLLNRQVGPLDDALTAQVHRLSRDAMLELGEASHPG